jgi:hypothetical protein
MLGGIAHAKGRKLATAVAKTFSRRTVLQPLLLLYLRLIPSC